MTSFYSDGELKEIGFKKLGINVSLSRKASIYAADNIEIGNHVRIDDFCVLSGKIIIGDHVHISAGNYLFAGNAGIIFEDYSSLSSHSTVYAVTDDYSGNFLTNSTVTTAYRNVIEKAVKVGRYAVIGAGCTVLPGVQIGEGCAFGAMSLINRSTKPWGIYVGCPCKRLKERSQSCLSFLK